MGKRDTKWRSARVPKRNEIFRDKRKQRYNFGI